MKHGIWRPLAEMKKEKLWYAIVVRDRQGKVVSRERRKAHSFLKQWNQLVYVHVTNSVYAGIVDTGGTPLNIQPYAQNFRMTAAAGQTTYGIRVGTGNTPVAIDNFALETPIEEGTGADQMEHLICTVANYVVAPPSCSHVVSRTIANSSGGVITVREAVCYMVMYDGALKYCCATRDVLAAPQAVPNGGAITIDWAIQVTA